MTTHLIASSSNSDSKAVDGRCPFLGLLTLMHIK